MRHLIAPLAATALLAAGCSSPAPHAVPPPTWPPSQPPVASATNALADLPQDLGLKPGERNFWDLDPAFALANGGDDQFANAGAVQLHVGIPAGPPTADSLPSDFNTLAAMPLDLTQADLSFTSPVVTRGAAQLAAVADVPGLAGGNSLLLAGSLGLAASGGSAVPTRLSQAVDLTQVPAGTNVVLGWTHQVQLLDGTIAGPAAPAWRVVVRIAGLTTLLVHSSSTSVATGNVAFTVPGAAGNNVTVDFELLGSPRSFAALDDVSLKDGATEHLQNGDFSAGLASWTVSGADLPCQVVAAARTVGGLKVVRQFLARPDQRWGRYLDTYENTGGVTLTTQANYVTELGAGTEAVIQSSAGGKAFSAWDASPVPYRRDLALVFGSSSLPPAYRGTTVPVPAGVAAWTRFPLTLAPGQKKVVVHFVVLTEDVTGETAADLSARATRADQVAADIASGFWSDAAYREGMTAEQEGALANF